MNRFSLTSVIFCTACCLTTSLPAAQQPNIVWLMAEDISTELTCYGHPAVATPNLDRLATQGSRYDNAFCTAPSCTPSRNAMLTGVYQTRTDTQDQRRGGIVLPPDIKPITYLLRDAGYYTALGCGYSAKTDHNFQCDDLFDGNDWKHRSEGQPFFAQITLYDSHRMEDQWQAITDSAIRQVDRDAVVLPPYFPDHPACREDWARYLEAIQAVDRKVGQVLNRLKREKIENNTLVIFIGDNGRCHLRGKCWLYDGGIKVPLIMRWPGSIDAGTTNDDIISMIDVSATILDAAGIMLPSSIDGIPLLGPNRLTRSHIFAARDLIDEVSDPIRCVRTKRFKYIRNYKPENGYHECDYVRSHRPMLSVIESLDASGSLTPLQQRIVAKVKPVDELYDLQEDPHELNNLADDPQHHSRLAELKQILNQWIDSTQDQGLKRFVN